MSYTIKQIDDILSYGPSGTKGESRALAEQLKSTLRELERCQAELALPEVVEVLAERKRRLAVEQARKVLTENGYW